MIIRPVHSWRARIRSTVSSFYTMWCKREHRVVQARDNLHPVISRLRFRLFTRKLLHAHRDVGLAVIQGMQAKSLTAYEQQRDATVAENQAKLRALGLERVVPTPPPRQQARRRAPTAAEPLRSSKRTRSAAPDYTGVKIDAFGDEERRLRTAAPAAAPAAAPVAAPKRRKGPRVPSAIVDAVRAYVEEHVPEEHTLEEREMFGMVMWLVNGNMFLGVGLRTEKLLVRVGDSLQTLAPALGRATTLTHTPI